MTRLHKKTPKKKGRPQIHENCTPRKASRGGKGSTSGRVMQEYEVPMSLHIDEEEYGIDETQMPIKNRVEGNAEEIVMETQTLNMEHAEDMRKAGYEPEEVEALFGRGGSENAIVIE